MRFASSMRGVRAAWPVLLSCCSYHPGSFRDRTGTWPTTRVTTPCLDLAVARHDRPDVPGAVIAYSIGNRCEERVTVDLASVVAIGRDSLGNERALVAYDPRHELRPRELGALWSGEAEIAYSAGDATLDSVCVDVGHVDRDHRGSAHWMCFAKEAP